MVEMLYRLDMMPHNSPGIRDILVFLAPWIRNINISHFQSSYTDGTSSETAIAPEVKLCLMNLFYLTIRFGVEFVHELEDIWSQVLLNSEYDFNGMETESSVSIITSYLVAVSLRKRNPSAVMVSKNITVYMARCENAGGLVVDAVMEKIKPEFAVPYDNATLEQSELADIARALPMDPVDTLLIDMPGRPPFSPTQLSLLLLVDAVLQVPPRHILPHLPTLLHAAVVHLDHPSKFIVDECVCLLGSLVQALVPDESMGLFYTLGNEEWKLRYEDLTPPTILSLSSVKTLGRITDRILQVFTKVVPDLQSAWGGVSLKWGIECPVRHIACRSLQIYRCLSPRVFDKRDLSQLLTRCGSTLGDCVSVDVQGYALDCLLTVKVVAKNACPITEFLELWWAGVACLYSPLKWEYEEGLNLLLDLMSRMSQSPTDQLKTSDGIRICKPVTWRGKSCLDMILRGLRVDQELSDKCLKLLNILVPLDNVLDSGVDQRVLYGICANLPSMMASFESTGSALASSASSPEVSATLAPVYKRAKDLHTLCSSLPRLSALSHLLLSFSKQKFRSRDDFIGQTLALLKESFPAETSALLDFFLGLFVCETPEDSKTREQVVQILLSMMRVYEPAVLCSKGGKSLDVWSPLLHYLLSQSVVSESLLQLLELILSSGSGSGEAIEEVVFGERQLVRIQREFGGDKAGEYLSQVKSNMSCTGRVCQSRFLPVVHGVSAE